MSRATTAEINISALHHNLNRVRQIAPHSKIIAMVKADGYGHGMLRIAEHLPEVDAFGVACLEEAVLLRDAGIAQTIILMEGFYRPTELDTISKLNFEIVVHEPHQVETLLKTKLTKPLNIWLKIDTGMHRLGFPPEKTLDLYQSLNSNPQISKINLMTHFSDADHLEKSKTQNQIELFHSTVKDLSVDTSLCNSAGILGWPQAHANWVRPGLMLYGVSPFKNKTGMEHDLKPVMTLRSDIMAIHDCQKGDAIGYGERFICPESMRIGIIALGYGDGYPYHAPNGTPILIETTKKAVPLIGSVSMDMLAVDLRQARDVAIDDAVILWGDGLPVEIIAQHAQTIPYELLCNIKRRVRFEVV